MRLMKWLAAIVFAAAMPCAAMAQSSPNWPYKKVPTAAEWNNAFAVKQDVLGYVPFNAAGGVLTGRLVTAPPGASTSGFNLTPGSAPASPANGDLWATSVGLYAQINGATIGISNNNGLVAAFATKAAATAATIDPAVNVVQTLGYATAGDNGGAAYVRIGSSTAAAWRFQSADGQWWALSNRVVTPEMFGASAGFSDNGAAFTAMATWLGSFAPNGVQINNAPGAQYSIWPNSGGSPPSLSFIMDMTGVSGLTWNFNGGCIVTNNTFASTSAFFMKASTGSTGFVINNGCYFQSAKQTLDSNTNGGFFRAEAIAAPWARNFVFNNYYQNGGNYGLGFGGYAISNGVPVDNHVELITINNAYFENVYYPVSTAWGGDNLKGNITCHNAGRCYFAYNVSSHNLSIISDGGGPFNNVNLKVYAMPQLPPWKNVLSGINVQYKNVARTNATTSQSLFALEMQQDPQGVTLPTITGAINNGSGLIRLTIGSASAAAMTTGQTWFVNSVGGVPNATGNWVVTVVNNTTVDLQGSTFAGAYTSGGYMRVPGAMRDIHITMEVNNDANQQPPSVITYKLDSTGSADATTNNYFLDNISIAGTAINYNYGIPALDLFNNDSVSLGTWTGETIKNFKLNDLILGGTNSSVLLNASYFTSAELKNIFSTPITIPWTITGATSALRIENVAAANVVDRVTVAVGTGVATALAINTGSAGAFVVNGGALGSPSSVGTLPAITLGGTVSGGGNQINNVIIGASTPLAGSFTTVTATQTVQTGAVPIGSLPTCNTGAKGTRYFVTDANSTTFLAAAVNGGANNVPVVCDGTGWKVGANDNVPAWMISKAA